MAKLMIVELHDGENFEEVDRFKSLRPAERLVEQLLGKVYGYTVSRTPRGGYPIGADTRNYSSGRGRARILVLT